MQLSQGLEIKIIKAHLQKVSDTNKVVLYLVINEIVEFELTEKEKAVATHMSASAGCAGMLGASHERKMHTARAGERHWQGGLGLGRGATAPAGADSARCLRRAGSDRRGAGSGCLGGAAARCRKSAGVPLKHSGTTQARRWEAP